MTINLSRFIKNTDFKGLGNDNEATITLTIPSSFTIPAGNSITRFYTDVQVGSRNCPITARINNSRNASFWSPATAITVKADNSSMPSYGSLGPRYSSANIYRINATTLRLEAVFATSGEPQTVTCTGASQTVTAKIRTFKDPFLY